MNKQINQLKSNNSRVLTLRLPLELKKNIEKHAKLQGVSINQLSSYLLNREISQLDAIYSLEYRLSKRSIISLKKKTKKILDKIPEREVPNWDKID